MIHEKKLEDTWTSIISKKQQIFYERGLNKKMTEYFCIGRILFKMYLVKNCME